MLRLARRGIAEHKVRFALTTFAVVLGVGFVVGAFVVTDTLRSSVQGLFADISAGVDVSVRARSSLDAASSGGPVARGRIPADVLDTVRDVDGVAAAGGSVGGYAQLLDEGGRAVTTSGAPLLGVSWGDVDEVVPATMDEGSPPRRRGEVAIDRDTAVDYDLSVGDRTEVLLVGAREPVEIVGVFTFGESNSLLGARLTAFDLETAQDVFGAPGQLDTVDVVAEDGVGPSELAERIGAVLPEGVEAVPVEQVNAESAQGVEGFLRVFQNVLLGFAGVSLLVSAFFINNTFAILLGQRTREIALLRAVGASRRQVVASVLTEALLIGLLASVVGIGFGVVIALGLQSLLSVAGFALPEETLQLTPRTWAAGLSVGIPVTLLAAWVPARHAARVPPVVALRDGPTEETGPRARRGVGGAVVLGLGSAAVVLSLFVLGGAARWWFLAVGAFLTFLGVAQLSRLLAGPVVGLLGRSAMGSLTGRLARANAVRTPQRTARAASALMIGLALVTTVFVVGTSVKDSFARSIEGSVRADLVVSDQAFTGFSPTVAAAIAEIPEVTAVTGVRGAPFLVDGEPEAVTAVEPGAAAELVDVDVIHGDLTAVGPGAIAMHRDEADERGLAVGDRLRVEFASGGPTDLEVVAVYADATYAGNFVVDLGSFAAAYPSVALDVLVFARLADDADTATARERVEAVLAPFPQLTLQDRSEFEAAQREQLDQVLLAVNGLLGLALFIALMGISNTLALSVIERTREVGLLRAVGMGRGQVARMVLVESVLVATFGALLGVGVGMALGVGVTLALPASLVTLVAVPWITLGAVIVAAVVFGVLAGVVPARRAARLDILDAVGAG
jgi:putative ABC transport system permease protein